MELEMEELEANPEGERRELTLIYVSKGMPRADAEKDGCRDHPGQSKGPRDTGKRRIGHQCRGPSGALPWRQP